MVKLEDKKIKKEKIWSILEEKLGMDYESIIKSLAFHVEFTVGKERFTADDRDFATALCFVIRDRMMERWNKTQTTYYKDNVKRVYYLSMEYLMGRTLSNSLINLGIYDVCKKVMHDIGFDLEEICEYEHDAGLGNGGLGRLAACFLDSMATMGIPSMGYGMRYDYGIFRQSIVNGEQVERPDHWLSAGSPWETVRRNLTFTVNYYGKVNKYKDVNGNMKNEWIDTEKIYAQCYDYPIPGYENNTANTLRLWSARATTEFDLDYFNQGDYMKAVEDKNHTETITRVLYPRDDAFKGKELRLKQEYFFVCATIQDIIRRHRVMNPNLDNIAEKAVIQLNDTHPAIAISEMMRILVDLENYIWDKAWEITTNLFAYTNHTVMPEALERWSVEILGNLLPRHLEIIYEINYRFLNKVCERFPNDFQRLGRMSVIEEHNHGKSIRMANLSIVGTKAINGVAALHSWILKDRLFKDFYELWPEKFFNETNGITPRRWLKLCNPSLSKLITENIGDKWVRDLDELKKLIPLAKEGDFQQKWRESKKENKERLVKYIKEHNGVSVNIDSIFDCHVKRIHEYKRQQLNLLRLIDLYIRIKEKNKSSFYPLTAIFAGKAAPGYFMAKLIIKLINSVANTINNDPAVNEKLKVVFIENYGVSLGEIIFPAADLSEQISTAGMEASGTGNMKFALNGALTIGTLDGANIEIMEEVGQDNIFIFGLTEEEVCYSKETGYCPADEYKNNPRLKKCIDMIASGYFSQGDKEFFKPLIDSLLCNDTFMVLKDFQSYVDMHDNVSETYQNSRKWTEMSILNTANMGKFSSDRTIEGYMKDIWKVVPVKI